MGGKKNKLLFIIPLNSYLSFALRSAFTHTHISRAISYDSETKFTITMGKASHASPCYITPKYGKCDSPVAGQGL